ncbi:hypothetical protein SISSUDRAFT_1129894 [Sistotremastrum suecicum HHB10207 ss-3]|uniref:F-box domain-containing protein n=1 Tax=Sistotremastrum suecicum HHB10207 ss-3 TaxID=1314776 RepID=A0A166C3X2_9AGAM|nr:hypothetical protein SISSUDRAFT_1129894 [Sistotremastrum suecicum HHB10207 ss-3]
MSLTTTSPIRKIPTEVLSMVFVEYMENSDDPNEWAQLMLVCRSWRDTAIRTPALWTRINMAYSQLSKKLFLQRHGQFPFEITLAKRSTLNTPHPPIFYDPLPEDRLAVVASHRLVLSFPWNGASAIRKCAAEGVIVPGLKEIAILGHDENDDPTICEQLLSPLLNLLGMRMFLHACSSIGPNINTFFIDLSSIGGPPDSHLHTEVLRNLVQFPALEDLSIGGVVGDPCPHHEHERIAFPEVSTLRLFDSEPNALQSLLRRLDLPKLQSLHLPTYEIELPIDHRDIWDYPWQRIYEPFLNPPETSIYHVAVTFETDIHEIEIRPEEPSTFPTIHLSFSIPSDSSPDFESLNPTELFAHTLLAMAALPLIPFDQVRSLSISSRLPCNWETFADGAHSLPLLAQMRNLQSLSVSRMGVTPLLKCLTSFPACQALNNLSFEDSLVNARFLRLLKFQRHRHRVPITNVNLIECNKLNLSRGW